MSRARDLWAAARARFLPHHRYIAVENRVICQSDGGAFLVCRITEPLLYPSAQLAQMLADALNAYPDKRHPGDLAEPRG